MRSAPAHDEEVPVLQARGLCRSYGQGEGAVHALRDVDLDVAAGEFIVLLGASGSGKSTLLNLLGALDRPTHGELRFRGLALQGADDDTLTRYRRDHVEFYNLIPSLTALENVSLVTEISANPMPPGEALELVGLKDRVAHFPAQLSGGEQQRVAIARAIAKRPDLLLCDEPTGALDSRTGVLVLEALTRVNREFGTTTAIITHNAVIRQIAHRVYSFLDGRIAHAEVNDTRLEPSQVEW